MFNLVPRLIYIIYYYLLGVGKLLQIEPATLFTPPVLCVRQSEGCGGCRKQGNCQIYGRCQNCQTEKEGETRRGSAAWRNSSIKQVHSSFPLAG